MEKGKLKIYFGYAAGVGKTYTMLRDAKRLKASGEDVVLGYLEPHDRKDTLAQAVGLETLPVKAIDYKGIQIREFDVDRAIERDPEVILVDEMAHTNASGCRNAKRYQDIVELLNHGIDVWTTLNVQHLESLNDTMTKDLGISVNETVPDSLFDSEDTEVKIIDLEPHDLLERFEAGKVYRKDVIDLAMHNFFTNDHLLTLRAIALKRMAERINAIKNNGVSASNILVLMSPSPTSANLIRVASQMAKERNTIFTALYIASASKNLDESQEKNLTRNMELVKDLGGVFAIKYSSDIIEAIYGYVTLNKITSIIIGKSWDTFFRRVSLEDKIAMTFSDIEVLIVPTKSNITPRTWAKAKWTMRNAMLFSGIAMAIVAGVVFAYDVFAGGIVSISFLLFLTAFSTYFALKNVSYKKRIDSHIKVTDCVDYIVREVQGVLGDDRAVRIAKCLSTIFKSSIDLEIGKTVVKVKFKDQSLEVFDEEKERSIRSWVLLNGREAGAGTATLNDSNAITFPLSFDNRTVGLVSFLCLGEGNEFSIENKLLFDKLLPLIESLLATE